MNSFSVCLCKHGKNWPHYHGRSVKFPFHITYWSISVPPEKIQADSYLLKVINTNTTVRWEICSKLTIKTPERCKQEFSDVFLGYKKRPVAWNWFRARRKESPGKQGSSLQNFQYFSNSKIFDSPKRHVKKGLTTNLYIRQRLHISKEVEKFLKRFVPCLLALAKEVSQWRINWILPQQEVL